MTPEICSTWMMGCGEKGNNMVPPINRREFFGLAAAGLAPLALPVLAWSGDGDEVEKNPAKDMITPKAQAAIDRGLKYLEENQSADGSWGSQLYKGNIAVTSLAALAFMAGGNQPGRGPYGKCVDRAIEYVLDRQAQSSEPGFINSPGGSQNGAMYNHGFGTLLLAEAYGMVSKKETQKRVRTALEGAVALIKKAQNQLQGGWRYDTKGNSADVSVTICQIMALRAARNAGIKVEKSIVDKCVKYVQTCQNSDGGFKYMKAADGFSLFPRSAAGVVALNCAGIYDGPKIESGLKYLMQFKPTGQAPSPFGRGMNEMHYFYGHYYAAQAMWTAGGKYWQEWFPAIREDLLRRVRTNGSWLDPMVCTDYGTAMACIILQIPNNYLPIMQK
jgi:hypothetical protein